MTDNIAADFAGAAGVDTNMRTPSPTPGSYPAVELISMRHVQQLAGPGVLVTYNIDGSIRGHRISLKKIPGYAVNYGVRDTKILIGALCGWGAEDPRTKAIDEAMIRKFVGPEQAGAGKVFTLEVTQGKENPKKPGQFFMNCNPYPAKEGATVAAKPSAEAIKAAQTDGDEPAAPPPPVPPAQSAVAWFPLPADHGARAQGCTEYNAAGDVR